MACFRGYPPDEVVPIYSPVSNSWRYGPRCNTPRSRSLVAVAISDRGQHWQEVYDGTVGQVAFADKDHGWISSDEFILGSTDGRQI